MKVSVPGLHVGKASSDGGVTLFPVWTDAAYLDMIVTGTAAKVTAGELPDGAEVPYLTVTNKGKQIALLLEGELLEGGRQTRALTGDLLIAPGAMLTADVVCVEAGRWHGSAAHARRARRVSPSVQQALRGRDGSPSEGRQHKVWQQVARYEQAVAPTASTSLGDHLDNAGGSAAAPEALPGQVGVIVGIAGWPVHLDLFASPRALAAHLPGLVAAARLDARLASHAEPVPGRHARRFAAIAEALALAEGGPAGLGRTVTGKETTAAARGVATPEGRLAHLSVLNLRHELVTE
jgi:hypothetical protein